MINSIASPPGYQLQEYRIVLQPHEDLCNRITNMRAELATKYRIATIENSRPAITLVHFFAPAMTEETILQRLQNVAMGIAPFQVELKDFGAYPSHTVFINIATPTPIQSLVRELKRLKPLMNVPDHDPHFIMEPHLLLLQRLKPMQFINLWMECEHSHFSSRFIADAMILLKRSEPSSFEEVIRIELASKPVSIKQGELFS